jgi:hypothetical protein
MRLSKLVEMIKEIGRSRIDETNHGRRYKKTKTHLLPSGRYGASVKLAEEEPDENPGKTMTGQPANYIEKEPKVNSIKQDR